MLQPDAGNAGVEENALDPRHQNGEAAGCSCRARSWPQAASMSSPRVARVVVDTPASWRTDWKAWARAFEGGASGLPSMGFIGIRLTWLRRWRTTVASRRAWSTVSLTPWSKTYS